MNCNLMYDPHTRESRCFGFLEMEDVDAASTATNELNGSEIMGRAISIEKV